MESIQKELASTATFAAPDSVVDPFAGNDIRGMEALPAAEEELSEDPFACLM
jgi:hypothetical protein